MKLKGKGLFLFGTVFTGFLLVGSCNISVADTNNSNREKAVKINKTVTKLEKINQSKNEDRVEWQTKKKIQKGKKFNHSQAKTVGNYGNYIYAKKPKTMAKAYIVLDRKNGKVLLAKNANKRYLTASTGKLMTIYLARRKLANNKELWKKKIKFPKSLIKMVANPNLNCFHIKKGRKYTIKQVLASAIVDSDNNSAIRLGQWVAGSNKKFLAMMNKQAKLWHLTASFTSASGLENDDLLPYGYYVNGKTNSGNLMSAKGLAIIAYHVAHDYPDLMKYFCTPEMYVAGQKMHNYNNTLPGRKYYVKSLKPDGMKTGWTPRSGYCFVGSCRKGNGRIVAILDDLDDFTDANKLLKFTYKYCQ